jgi:hypothetical protein
MFKQKHLFICLLAAASMPACRPTVVDPVPTVEPEVLKCNISSPITLTNRNPAGVDYIVSCEVYVTAQITVEPGVTIVMKSGSGIEMYAPFYANGTADRPIIIKGENDTPGFWKSILLASGDNGNTLNYCTISNGGGGSMNGDASLNGNVVVLNETGLNMNHTTLEKSGALGIYGRTLGTKKQFQTFTANILRQNTLAPIKTTPSNVTALEATNTFENNGVNRIEIAQGVMTGANRWRKLGLNYYCSGTVAIQGAATDNLIIDAGVDIAFGSSAHLRTNEYNACYMRFEGTAAEPISLHGLNSVQGDWEGVCFQSTNTQNSMVYTNIKDGGGGAFTGAGGILGNIVIGGYSTGRCRLQYVKSTNSAGCGLKLGTIGSNAYVDDGNNTFSGNAGGSVCN